MSFSKRCISIFCTLILSTGIIFSQAAMAGSEKDKDDKDNSGVAGQKVTICHKGETISVSVAAQPAHENHGDLIGDCVDDPGEPPPPEPPPPGSPGGGDTGGTL